MPDQYARTLMAQGLQAFRGGGDVAMAAISEIHRDTHDPELQIALQESQEQSGQWAQRIERAIGEVGLAEGPGDGIIKAHFDTDRLMRQKAPDDLSRDLGIIAVHQIALHYWIAAFGTLRTYAQSLGLTQTVQDMQACIDEAGESDRQATNLAVKLLAARET